MSLRYPPSRPHAVPRPRDEDGVVRCYSCDKPVHIDRGAAVHTDTGDVWCQEGTES